MRSQQPTLAARLRPALFAMCAACTLWLIVQNTILLTLIPQAWLPAALRGAAIAVRAALAWSIPLFLIPLAFATGWLASRSPVGSPRPREDRDE